MFNPGLGSDKLLVKTQYQEMLDQSAEERAQQKRFGRGPALVATSAITLVVVMPLLLWIVWAHMAG